MIQRAGPSDWPPSTPPSQGAYQSVTTIIEKKNNPNPPPNAILAPSGVFACRARWKVRSRYGQSANPNMHTGVSQATPPKLNALSAGAFQCGTPTIAQNPANAKSESPSTMPDNRRSRRSIPLPASQINNAN